MTGDKEIGDKMTGHRLKQSIVYKMLPTPASQIASDKQYNSWPSLATRILGSGGSVDSDRGIREYLASKKEIFVQEGQNIGRVPTKEMDKS